MPAGTIALTNNSATVTGTGTSFTTELKVGDFIGVTVGSATYTAIVGAIASNTSLTLTVPFNGPTTSGLAWYGIPASLKIAITQQVLNDMGTVARGMILEKANWQKIFSSDQSVTVTMPDRTTFTGPSWGYMSTQIDSKVDSTALDAYAKKGANSDITGLSGLTTALSIGQGGTGQKTAAAAWGALAQYGTAAGTAAQGNDTRLNTIDNKSGGTLTKGSSINLNADPVGTGTGTVNEVAMVRGVLNGRRGGEDGGGAAARLFLRETSGSDILAQLRVSGLNTSGVSTVAGFNFLYTGVGQATTWQNLSDERLKENITTVDNALAAVLSWRGVTFDYRVSDEGYSGGQSVGLIEQDVEKWCPHAVSEIGTTYTFGGEAVTDAKALNTSGVSAAYHTEAIKMLFSLVELALTDPDAALKSIDAIKASVTTRD